MCQNEIGPCCRSGVKAPEFSSKYMGIPFSCGEMDLWPQTDVLRDDSRSLLVHLSCVGGTQWDPSQDSGPESCLLKMTHLFPLTNGHTGTLRAPMERGCAIFPELECTYVGPETQTLVKPKLYQTKQDSLGCLRLHGNGADQRVKGKHCCKWVPGRERAKVSAGGRHRTAPKVSDTLQIAEELNSVVIKLSMVLLGSPFAKEGQKDAVRE